MKQTVLACRGDKFVIAQEFLSLCNVAADIDMSGGHAVVCAISDTFIRFKLAKTDDHWKGWISEYDSEGFEKGTLMIIEEKYLPVLTCGVVGEKLKHSFSFCTKIVLTIIKHPEIQFKKESFVEHCSIVDTSTLI
jgi:hypothetical protein